MSSVTIASTCGFYIRTTSPAKSAKNIQCISRERSVHIQGKFSVYSGNVQCTFTSSFCPQSQAPAGCTSSPRPLPIAPKRFSGLYTEDDLRHS
jgi:hypothetical protein